MTFRFHLIISSLVCLSLLTSVSPVHAASTEEVTVVGTVETTATGLSTLSTEVIDALPRGNGSLNEMLGFFPDVQLGEDARSSRRGGEILPPTLSISGGKSFQNNFSIDGIGNNSLLDPTADNPMDINNVPGHPQEVFVDSRLIDEIILHDSNVPARLGGFTGGAVEVRTKNPGTRFAGSIDYRTTRSEWTSFHLSEKDQANLSTSSSSDLQPRFEKHDAGVLLDIPLGDDMGALLSYRILNSRIPLNHQGQSKSESRRLESFFLKHALYLGDDDLLETTLLYTPYKAERFVRKSRNSEFTTQGGGLALGSNLTHFSSLGEIRVGASLRRSHNKREAPANWFQWQSFRSKSWGQELFDSPLSFEGGFGDLSKTQTTFTSNASLIFADISSGDLNHQITTGIDFERIQGTFERPENATVYYGATFFNPLNCGADELTCATDEQFFTQRNIYKAGITKAEINQAAIHIDDRITARRLTLQPGLRLDIDDYMDNFNLAPRFAAQYDLLGNNNTIFTVGLNRYYGRSLLTFKLRELMAPYETQSRAHFGQLLGWEIAPSSGGTISHFSKLKTPYSDEATFGLDQKLAGGLLSAKYVYRRGHDEFARELSELKFSGVRIYTINNNGSSRHESYRIAWERTWSTQALLVNLTYQQSQASNEDYNDILGDDASGDRVWFNEEIVDRSELPKGNYNRPWVANLIYSLELGQQLRFTNTAKYRSGYRNLEPTGETRAIGAGEGRIDPLTGEEIFEALGVYAEVKRAGALIFDWRLDWSPGPQGLVINLELYNVFNRRVETGIAGEFEMGRQLWAGASWSF